MTAEFDESKVNRQRDGKFGERKRDEAQVGGPEGVDLTPDDHLRSGTLADVVADPALGRRSTGAPGVIGPEDLPDCEGRIDYLEVSRIDFPVGTENLNVTARIQIGDGLLRSAASVMGSGHDEDEDDEAGLEWLHAHQDDLERVLAEDYDAELDASMDSWDSQDILMTRSMAPGSTVDDAVEALAYNDTADPLHTMIASENFEVLIGSAEQHAADRKRAADLTVRALDHLINTRGNDAAEKARYLTLTHKWNDAADGEATKFFEVKAYDSDGNGLTEPFVVTGIDFDRKRVPSNYLVTPSDSNWNRLLNHAANDRHMIDLNRVTDAAIGRART